MLLKEAFPRDERQTKRVCKKKNKNHISFLLRTFSYLFIRASQTKLRSDGTIFSNRTGMIEFMGLPDKQSVGSTGADVRRQTSGSLDTTTIAMSKVSSKRLD